MENSEINNNFDNIFFKKYIMYGESKTHHPSSDDIFFIKYIMYKNKYLNLKKQIFKLKKTNRWNELFEYRIYST